MPRARRATRRSVLGQTLAGGGAAWAASVSWSRPAFAAAEANDRPGIGCIGLGAMGMTDAEQHARFGDIVAVCDVDFWRADRAKYNAQIGAGRIPDYEDYRRVLDRPDVDVVSIATHDPWHVKIAIEALQAGKHVFCQAPLSLTLEESRLARAAAAKHPRQQFFIGTQQRGDRDRFLRAVNIVRKGILGPIRRVTVRLRTGPAGGPFPAEPVPQRFNWDRWLGPAPWADYCPQRCRDSFRWWYEYSGGAFTDRGAHHVDVAQWALGEDTPGKGPVEIEATHTRHPVPFRDGVPTVADCYNTAQEFRVRCRFASGVEMILASDDDDGILFEGARGSVFVNRRRITGTPIDEGWDRDAYTDEDRTALFRGKPAEGHKQHFHRCLREGGLPISDVVGHAIALNTCHLAAIAARLGRAIRWDPAAETIVGDEQAAAFATRTPRPGFEMPTV